ncbi:AbiJ-NTD4 domain-containing protein [Stenotrophomonas maltophilia]|uniref:AbiJ-NTD4 domain-containing protein n=1 Tax=Stenotrophomonas maltophilia TaxID=40324 RepID=UPI0025542E82|nr:hypothetical protein [Stenotrophomonas maltophilia]
MLFSQRMDLKPVRVDIQLNGMDKALRVALWNAYQLNVIGPGKNTAFTAKSSLMPFFRSLWDELLHEPVDKIPTGYDSVAGELRRYFFDVEWHGVYDFLEFSLSGVIPSYYKDRLIPSINLALAREMSGYRLINSMFSRITDTQEISNIEEALNRKDAPLGATLHLRTALALMSDRVNPDYRNSIKESISAVESIAKHLTNNPKASLGDALLVIEKKGEMHNALRKGLSSLYGYTSDAQGIRHALLDETDLTFVDAKFMLVACSGFVNFMIEKSASA